MTVSVLYAVSYPLSTVSDRNGEYLTRTKTQTPLDGFVVDLLYNKLYNKSTTNPQQIRVVESGFKSWRGG